jgi:hypothetical protein
MGFWESFKAAFLGGAGVDYYAKKSYEELRGLRTDLGTPANAASDPKQIQAAFGQVETAILELHRALTTKFTGEDRWLARIDLAFVELVSVLDRADVVLPFSDAGGPGDTLQLHRRRAEDAFRRAAERQMDLLFAEYARLTGQPW